MIGRGTVAVAAKPTLQWWHRRVGSSWGVAFILVVDLIAFTAVLSPGHSSAPAGDAASLALCSAGEG